MDRIKAILENSPLVIGLAYVFVGFLWIEFSDQLVFSTFRNPEMITQVQSYKGWFFVMASGLAIYLLVWKNNALMSDAFEKIEKSRDEFKATFEYAPVGIAHHRPNENWVQVNQTLCDILGYKKEELLRLNFEDFIHPDDLKEGRELDRQLINGERTFYKVEKRYRRKDGSYFTGVVSKSGVYNRSEIPVYLVVMLEDITKRKRAEEALKKTLNEKEVLLGEIHHRVRNNLALISALFELQTMYAEDEHINAILHDSQMRVKCMALVHESYKSQGESASIDFGEYLGELVDFVHRTFKYENENVDIKKNIPSTILNINQAIPAGLLCNELLLNAYANLGQNTEAAIMEVSLEQKGEEVYLTVTDNGKERCNDFDLAKPATLGMLIIKTLNSQLHGNLKLTEENGLTSIRLNFQKRDLKGPSSSLNG